MDSHWLIARLLYCSLWVGWELPYYLLTAITLFSMDGYGDGMGNVSHAVGAFRRLCAVLF